MKFQSPAGDGTVKKGDILFVGHPPFLLSFTKQTYSEITSNGISTEISL
jgi:hypothetical protein